jgi:DNA-binding response OmpR family regulator
MIDGHRGSRPPANAPMRSVLILDRDAETRIAAQRVLERARFAVSAAMHEGAHAAGHFDLVIADRTAASLTSLRRRHPQARILTVSRQGGADLAKPFTPSQLLSAVRLCLARR